MAAPIIVNLLRTAGAAVAKHIGGKGATAAKGAKSAQQAKTTRATNVAKAKAEGRGTPNRAAQKRARQAQAKKEGITLQQLNKQRAQKGK